MLFLVAAILDFIAALLHVACVIGGGNWYRFFGAGEALASMAERGSWLPGILTSMIASILAFWGLYYLSIGGVIGKLPFLVPLSLTIAIVYGIRGVYPFLLSPWVPFFRTRFMVVTSVICIVFAVVHGMALWEAGII